MKKNTRTLVRDIKAAAQIGHIESIWMAMDTLAQVPEVKGNHPLSDSFIIQVILPTAQALSSKRVSKSALIPLLNHEKAAIRAAASSALALSYLKNFNGISLKDLQTLEKEPRKEVREATILACQQAAVDYPEKTNELVNAWLAKTSPRLQSIAIRLLSDLPKTQAVDMLEQIGRSELPKDPEVRASLAKTIDQLAHAGEGDEAIRILQLWSQHLDSSYWVVTRCLAKNWAVESPTEAMQILTRLAEEKGAKKKIRNALQTFWHNGASDVVQETIETWRTSDNPNLHEAGEDAHEKLIQSANLD